MKHNPFTLLVGALLLVVFGCLLFSFQVRQTEVALVTTFGKPSRSETKPGLKFRLPWPIQSVLKFDSRIQNFEGRFKESYTTNRYNLLVQVFAGWRIDNPALFRERFGGSLERARSDLDGLIESSKNVVVGRHPLAHFVSTDPNQLKFDDIEKEILTLVAPQAKANYGVDVSFIGLKRVGLPESITQSVFNNMKEERGARVASLKGQGDSQASQIRSGADVERAHLLAAAEAEAIAIHGQAENAAASSLAVFNDKPALANFLLKREGLENALKDRATLIFSTKDSPFDLLAPDGTVKPSK